MECITFSWKTGCGCFQLTKYWLYGSKTSLKDGWCIWRRCLRSLGYVSDLNKTLSWKLVISQYSSSLHRLELQFILPISIFMSSSIVFFKKNRSRLLHRCTWSMLLVFSAVRVTHLLLFLCKFVISIFLFPMFIVFILGIYSFDIIISLIILLLCYLYKQVMDPYGDAVSYILTLACYLPIVIVVYDLQIKKYTMNVT